jgi:hypothetical protein
MDVITKIHVSKWYLLLLSLLWTGSVGSAAWGWPVWTTISFVAMFMIYAGHEWMHVWVAEENGLTVNQVILDVQGDQETIFSGDSEDPDMNKKFSKVFLAGSVWDSIWFTITCLSSIFYSLYTGDITAMIFGSGVIIVLIFNLACPGSDWQNYMKRTAMRA